MHSVEQARHLLALRMVAVRLNWKELPMKSDEPAGTRRHFLLATAAAGAGIGLIGCQTMMAGGKEKGGGKEEEKVTPGEDLMQEHGVLKRLLLVYGEGIRRIGANEELPPEPLLRAARLVRSF